MTEHKFTDEEIKKALDCCSLCKLECDICPFREDRDACIDLELVVLDLINRYEAEIENLTQEISNLSDDYTHLEIEKDNAIIDMPHQIKYIQTETTKEFAERLKEAPIKCSYPLFGLSTKDEITEYFNDIMMQFRDAIDTIAKEMTGGAQ